MPHPRCFLISTLILLSFVAAGTAAEKNQNNFAQFPELFAPHPAIDQSRWQEGIKSVEEQLRKEIALLQEMHLKDAEFIVRYGNIAEKIDDNIEKINGLTLIMDQSDIDGLINLSNETEKLAMEFDEIQWYMVNNRFSIEVQIRGLYNNLERYLKLTCCERISLRNIDSLQVTSGEGSTSKVVLVKDISDDGDNNYDNQFEIQHDFQKFPNIGDAIKKTKEIELKYKAIDDPVVVNNTQGGRPEGEVCDSKEQADLIVFAAFVAAVADGGTTLIASTSTAATYSIASSGVSAAILGGSTGWLVCQQGFWNALGKAPKAFGKAVENMPKTFGGAVVQVAGALEAAIKKADENRRNAKLPLPKIGGDGGKALEKGKNWVACRIGIGCK